MEKYINVLKNSQLFRGIDGDDINSLLSCLNAQVRNYPKGSYVLHQGEYLHHITILAEGSLHIQKDDFWGNRSIIHLMSPGEMFGEAYAAPESGPIINDVIAATDSCVIFIDVHKVLSTCSASCRFHSLLIQNLFFAVSARNRSLVQKIEYLSQRTTRKKILSYLSEQAIEQNSSCIEIPFNRQQLADFLSVDRSAMSKELCKLRDEGILTFKKNHFYLRSSEPVERGMSDSVGASRLSNS